MAMLEKEDFWGCGLNKGSKIVFNPEFEDSELSEVEHKLILIQACLGPKATGRSIVEVTAQDYKGEEVSFSIAALREGATEMCPLNFSFSPPVTFKLVEGSGPVYLTGNHVQNSAPELVETVSPVKNKRPLPTSTKKGPPNKLAKIANNEESDEEDTDEEESDEEDGNSPKAMKQDKQQSSSSPKGDRKIQERYAFIVQNHRRRDRQALVGLCGVFARPDWSIEKNKKK